MKISLDVDFESLWSDEDNGSLANNIRYEIMDAVKREVKKELKSNKSIKDIVKHITGKSLDDMLNQVKEEK